jgi:two-component system nitrate/nitrite response regulator NarL
VLVVAAGTMGQAGLAALVESVDGLEVAATVAPAAARATAEAIAFDACLVDVEARRDEGAVAALVEAMAVPVVVICEPEAAAAAIDAGARGALGPGIGAAALGSAITAVVSGLEVVFPPGSRRPARGEDAEAARIPLREPLTARELQVLRLLAEGLTNQQVARRLAISEHTAKFHVAALLGKLDAQSRTEAVTRGYQLGLVSV